MSFPSSPTTGQTAVVNNITYLYSESTRAWTRVAGQVTATTYLSIINNTPTNSTITGALQVVGGVGIGGGLFVGGVITATSFVGTFIGSGAITTATNLLDGTAGQLVYQTGPGATRFAGPGTAGQVLVSAGTSAPVYTNTASIYVNDAVVATNIRAGTAGQLVYNSAANTTGFVGAGTAGQLLVSGGAAIPVYTNTASIYVGRALIADSATGGAGSVVNALTISTGLTGTVGTYNGSAAVTVSLNTATYMASAAIATVASKVTNTHSAGIGLTGTAFDGSSAQTWTLNTATLMATAVTSLSASGSAGSVVNSLTAGTGLSGTAFNGSAAVTWTNAGVTSNVAGTGVSVSGATGAVTISIGQAVATSSNVQFNSLGVGTAGSATTGEIRATNEITAYYSSDARLKVNVVKIDNPMEKLNQIRGVYFDWTDETIKVRGGEDGYFVRKHDIGVIAQEVEAVLPEIVATRDDGFKAVKYEKLVPLLIEAIKTLEERIRILEGKLGS